MTFLVNYGKKFSALIPATALVFLDQTILPVALPSIRNEMVADSTVLQWCVNAYLLTIAIFVLISGKFSDRIGHKTAYMWGILGFVGCSIMCSLSQTVEFLILARALQGVSAALIRSCLLALDLLDQSTDRTHRSLDELHVLTLFRKREGEN